METGGGDWRVKGARRERYKGHIYREHLGEDHEVRECDERV